MNNGPFTWKERQIQLQKFEILKKLKQKIIGLKQPNGQVLLSC